MPCGETFPEFDAWLADSQHDVEFRRQWFRDNPLNLDDFMGQLKEEVFEGNGYLEDFDADDVDDFDSGLEPSDTIVTGSSHIGRNDPCPCGSGKKYKKCCWGKARHFENN
jgi:preprotein translocase subunit SecA